MSNRPTAEYLRERLDYDPHTGVFRWRPVANPRKGWNKHYAGTIAGNHSGRYAAINILGSRWMVHRLAWLYVYGEWAPFDLDHVDNDPTNNRIANLRPATRSQNNVNSKTRSDNKLGIKGVTFTRNGYQVRVGNGYVGRFKTAAEAQAAYVAAATEMYGDFVRAS